MHGHMCMPEASYSMYVFWIMCRMSKYLAIMLVVQSIRTLDELIEL